jgi:hypothetical protein
MTSLKENDLNYIVRHIPKDLRKLMMDHSGDAGIRIGGGFIRSIIAGEKISDIDVFGSSRDQLKIVSGTLAYERNCVPHESQNAYTLLSPPRWPVQFIFRWTFDSPDLCMASFDFTIAQSVIWYDNDKQPHWQSICHDNFYSDLAAHRLVYTFPQRIEDAGGSIMRVRKFLSKGYNIQPESFAGVISRVCMGVDQVAKSVPGESFLSKLVQSLLIEVDPLVIVDGMELICDDNGNNANRHNEF